jgi:hypothetical protein
VLRNLIPELDPQSEVIRAFANVRLPTYQSPKKAGTRDLLDSDWFLFLFLIFIGGSSCSYSTIITSPGPCLLHLFHFVNIIAHITVHDLSGETGNIICSSVPENYGKSNLATEKSTVVWKFSVQKGWECPENSASFPVFLSMTGNIHAYSSELATLLKF